MRKFLFRENQLITLMTHSSIAFLYIIVSMSHSNIFFAVQFQSIWTH